MIRGQRISVDITAPRHRCDLSQQPPVLGEVAGLIDARFDEHGPLLFVDDPAAEGHPALIGIGPGRYDTGVGGVRPIAPISQGHRAAGTSRAGKGKVPAHPGCGVLIPVLPLRPEHYRFVVEGDSPFRRQREPARLGAR
jgi:hypothetical protein